MCSVVGIKSAAEFLMAASYDFYYGHGSIFVNKRGLHKQGLAQQPPYLEWDSRFGSVTLNQFGRELPTAGMNECGLCIHLLEQRDGGYLPPTPKHLNEIQWIQYQLDCFSSVDEVIANLHEVSIENSFFNLHYALCDSQGKFVFIDFINGRPTVSTPQHEQPIVLTNDTYQYAQSKFKLFKNKKIPQDNSSMSRFIRLAKALQTNAYSPVSEDAFKLLDLVSRAPGILSIFKWLFLRQPPASSFWGSVFDPVGRKVYWRTKSNKNQRYIEMENLDFSTKSPVLTVDINCNLQGDVTSFLRPVERVDNEVLIAKSYAPLKDKVNLEDQKLLIDYPDSFTPV
jgi:penicillin V acylase-like amidase (Ntn superfamily)